MDTTSNALSRILDILASHPEAQEKLRLEIMEGRQQYGDEIPYDKLVALPYLDAVCRETLRLWVMFDSVSCLTTFNDRRPLQLHSCRWRVTSVCCLSPEFYVLRAHDILLVPGGILFYRSQPLSKESMVVRCTKSRFQRAQR
jgi:hypothetical protein